MSKAFGAATVKVWEDYLAALPVAPQDDFARNLHAYGLLPPDLVSRCAAAIKDAPEADYRAKSYRSAWTDGPQPAGHAYKALDARTAWCMAEVMDALREPVAGLLGAPWRCLNVRSWISRPEAGTGASGPYEWHTDGEPVAMLKAMIYWTEIGGDGGGLEIDGGGGTINALAGLGLWMLFYNSKLMHRAVAPAVGERIATEITLCPWPRMDTAPRFMGANVRHPMYPLANEKDVL